MCVPLQYARVKYIVSIMVFNCNHQPLTIFHFDYKKVCTICMLFIDIVSCNKHKLRHLILNLVCKNKITIFLFT